MTIREQDSALLSDPASLYTATASTGLGVVATGVNVTLDETAGLQNGTATPGAATDADDNDILVASLPLTFASRLTALGTGTATGAALSGYTGAVGDTGSDAFTINVAPGASITNISFVGSTGALPPAPTIHQGFKHAHGLDDFGVAQVLGGVECRADVLFVGLGQHRPRQSFVDEGQRERRLAMTTAHPMRQ